MIERNHLIQFVMNKKVIIPYIFYIFFNEAKMKRDVTNISHQIEFRYRTTVGLAGHRKLDAKNRMYIFL